MEIIPFIMLIAFGVSLIVSFIINIKKESDLIEVLKRKRPKEYDKYKYSIDGIFIRGIFSTIAWHKILNKDYEDEEIQTHQTGIKRFTEIAILVNVSIFLAFFFLLIIETLLISSGNH